MSELPPSAPAKAGTAAMKAPKKKLLTWPTGSVGTCLRAVVSLLAGLGTALVLDYLLYRVGLPSKPFIYVSF
jgi:hypothetical protein